MLTWGPPPLPAPTTMSMIPSELKSAIATKMPPLNAGSNAKNVCNTVPFSESITMIAGPPPGPAATIVSIFPSWFMSPIAIRSSPENPGNGITEFICFPVSWSIRFTVLLTPSIKEELDAVILRGGVGVGEGVRVGAGVGAGVGVGAGLGAGLGAGVVVSTVMEIVLEAVLLLPAASVKVAPAILIVAVAVLFADGVKVAV